VLFALVITGDHSTEIGRHSDPATLAELRIEP
jgi:hypothetical protein